MPAFEIGFCDKNLARTRALDALSRRRAVGQVTARAIVLDFMQPEGAGRRLFGVILGKPKSKIERRNPPKV
jgi:hypothetical protein